MWSCSRPIDFHYFARFAVNVHGRLGSSDVFAVIRFELRQSIGDFTHAPTLVAVLVPKQLLRHARLEHFAVNVLEIELFVRRLAR